MATKTSIPHLWRLGVGLVLAAGLCCSACSSQQAGASDAALTATSTSAVSTTTATSTTAAASTTTVGEPLPEGLQAVMGIAEDPTTVGGVCSVWRVAGDAVASMRLPAEYSVGFGERGSTIVYSDHSTGRLHIWHPDAPSTSRVVELPPTAGTRSAGDLVALSPDEQLLALMRAEYSEETGGDGGAVRGYLIDPQSGDVEEWDWFDRLKSVESGWVTNARWSKDSRSIYLSFGIEGSGERSYRYDFFTAESAELTGLAVVLDVGLQGQVVGLEDAAASVTALPGPVEVGGRPLVLWQDGAIVPLPRDERLVAWDHAWISDDGKTIVVYGMTLRHDAFPSCLEVLKLKEAGWQITYLYTPDESSDLVPGVAFQPSSDVFWFQSGSSGGLVTDVCLAALDTDTDQVFPFLRLPGAPDDFSIAKGIAGTGCRVGTRP